MNPKKLAAEKAVELVEDGMTVGLGTGTTAFFAIQAIGQKIKEGMKLQALASSVASENLAKEAGIPIIDFTSAASIDLTIDGADEVDENFYLIKGGGGALTREKILASNSKKFVVIIDPSKMVEQLGHFPLPIEVIPFGHNFTLRKLQLLGCKPIIRKTGDKFFQTDNGNLIADCSFAFIESPGKLNAAIQLIPGVVECGLFSSSLVHQVFVGFENGDVRTLRK
jgi:ribose 5-phosphate isomerase A